MPAFTYDATDKRSVNTLIGKVYGYMFFGILLTAIISFGVGILFNLWIFKTINPAEINYGDVENNINLSGAVALLVMLGITAIALFIMSFVIHIRAAKMNKSLAIPALIYCILMGMLLSELVLFVPWPVLGLTFLITSAIFGLMFLISYISKGNLNPLATVGIGLFIGAGLLSIIGLVLMLTGVLGAYVHLYWIISLLTFAGMMFITIWDMWRIKQIAEEGSMNENLVLYCAFILYIDFIYLFLRVLRIVSYFIGKKN